MYNRGKFLASSQRNVLPQHASSSRGSSPSSSSSSSGSTGLSFLSFSCLLFSTICCIFMYFNVSLVSKVTGDSSSSRSHNSNKINKALNRQEWCSWQQGDPVLYHLKTKLGVNYEGSHWFHMAENFMTQHAILRAAGSLSNASHVFYSFDKNGFVSELNGVTKMMVALGTLQLASATSSHAAGSSRLAANTLSYVYLNPPPPSGGSSKKDLFSSSKQGDYLSLPSHSFAKQHQHIDMRSIVPTLQRFLQTTTTAITSSSSSKEGSSICVKYMGTIGGLWPTPQRGHWFPNQGDIESFRSKLSAMCMLDASLLNREKGRKRYKLVIYQRDLTRKLANEEEALALLAASLPTETWDVRVLMHKKDRSPCELLHSLQDADVLLTPHGFQSMLLLFLPRPSLLFEIFPYRYYKRGYGPLSGEYGIIHAGVMSPPLSWHTKLFLALVPTSICMSNKHCRNYARGDNVHLTRHGVQKLLAAINEKLLVQLKDKRDMLLSTTGGVSLESSSGSGSGAR